MSPQSIVNTDIQNRIVQVMNLLRQANDARKSAKTGSVPAIFEKAIKELTLPGFEKLVYLSVNNVPLTDEDREYDGKMERTAELLFEQSAKSIQPSELKKEDEHVYQTE